MVRARTSAVWGPLAEYSMELLTQQFASGSNQRRVFSAACSHLLVPVATLLATSVPWTRTPCLPRHVPVLGCMSRTAFICSKALSFRCLARQAKRATVRGWPLPVSGPWTPRSSTPHICRATLSWLSPKPTAGQHWAFPGGARCARRSWRNITSGSCFRWLSQLLLCSLVDRAAKAGVSRSGRPQGLWGLHCRLCLQVVADKLTSNDKLESEGVQRLVPWLLERFVVAARGGKGIAVAESPAQAKLRRDHSPSLPRDVPGRGSELL